MIDYIRENLSYYPLFYRLLFTNKKEFTRNMVKIILRPFNKLFATNYASCSENAGRWMFGNKAYESGKVFLINNMINNESFL